MNIFDILEIGSRQERFSVLFCFCTSPNPLVRTRQVGRQSWRSRDSIWDHREQNPQLAYSWSETVCVGIAAGTQGDLQAAVCRWEESDNNGKQRVLESSSWCARILQLLTRTRSGIPLSSHVCPYPLPISHRIISWLSNWIPYAIWIRIPYQILGFANLFSHSVGCPLVLLDCFLLLLNFKSSLWSIGAFVAGAFEFRPIIPWTNVIKFCPGLKDACL